MLTPRNLICLYGSIERGKLVVKGDDPRLNSRSHNSELTWLGKEEILWGFYESLATIMKPRDQLNWDYEMNPS